MFKLFKLAKTKRGVSPVIAVVLLIALTVAAAAVIWAITNNLLGGAAASVQYNVSDVTQSTVGTTEFTNVTIKIKVSADATLSTVDVLSVTGETVTFDGGAASVTFTANNEKSVVVEINTGGTALAAGSYKMDLSFSVDGNTQLETVTFNV